MGRKPRPRVGNGLLSLTLGPAEISVKRAGRLRGIRPRGRPLPAHGWVLHPEKGGGPYGPVQLICLMALLQGVVVKGAHAAVGEQAAYFMQKLVGGAFDTVHVVFIDQVVVDQLQ